VTSLKDWIRYGDELRRPLCVASDLDNSSAVCVVGAGLSGLTVAYRIATKRPDIHVEIVEKSERCGGVIETWTQDGWICDVAVNATRAHPAFWRLVNDLDLGQLFSASNPKAKARWISTKGRRRKLSPLLIFKGGPLKVWRALKGARQGTLSVAEAMPLAPVNDAMTLGIVNDRSAHVDADFLMPSLTRFGTEPPVKWKRVKNMMNGTYPLFTPKSGSTASFEGGMQTLIDGLVHRLESLDNVSFTMNAPPDTPEEVAEARNMPLSSVIWCAPLRRTASEFTELNVYAVGYTEAQVSSVKVGYGTLIPDETCPVSGILHESDVHGSPRAPAGHRLFRVMAPSVRSSSHEEVEASLRHLLSESTPVVFEHIGVRRIPSYPPGYMASLMSEDQSFTRAGWFFSGVSVTHVVAEAERIADRF
tara:strand:+ start:604 stop:1860 length:1257 start_codon:yes stop_codon:yes gene_type:complete